MLLKRKSRPPVVPPPRLGAVAVGMKLDASCPKCRVVSIHVVTGKVGSIPTRVQCEVCASAHAYKAPRRIGRASPGAVPDERTVDGIWKDLMRRSRSAPVPYSSTVSYQIGAKLNHLTFGEGVVARLSSSTVCEVMFETGPVRLLMGTALRN